MTGQQPRTIPRESRCGILFLDIIAYSKRSRTESLECSKVLLQAVKDVLRLAGARECRYVALGDSICIVISGDKVVLQTFFVATVLQQSLLEWFHIRVGLHVGLVDTFEDGSLTDFLGDTIGVAHRVMLCGDHGHLLATAEFARELLLFKHDAAVELLGPAAIKHQNARPIFNIFGKGFGNPRTPRRFFMELLHRPVLLVLHQLSQMSIALDRLRLDAGRHPNATRFRSSILLSGSRGGRRCFVGTPFIAEAKKSWKPSRIAFPFSRTPFGRLWSASRTPERRHYVAFALPDPKAKRSEYLQYWKEFGIEEVTLKDARRPSRFYLHMPLWNASGTRKRGILCVDSLQPIINEASHRIVATTVSEHINEVEACFR